MAYSSVMASGIQVFPEVVANQFETYLATNPITNTKGLLHTKRLRLAILDSPFPSDDTLPPVATIIVPYGREKDPLFTTEEGHIYLFSEYYNLSQLVLVGNDPNETPFVPFNRFCSLSLNDKELKHLNGLLLTWYPAQYLQGGPDFKKIRFITYRDNLVYRVMSEEREGPNAVGKFVVERDEIELPGGERDLRLRLRFKSCPRFIQADVRIMPLDGSDVGLGLERLTADSKLFAVEKRVLVDDYSAAVLAGLSLASEHLKLPKPRCLCIGAGVGSLLDFMDSKLNFQSVGIDYEKTRVWKTAKDEFELFVDSFVFGNPLHFIEKRSKIVKKKVTNTKFRGSASKSTIGKFEVIVLNLNVPNKRAPLGICSPPREYITLMVLENLKKVLDINGILIIHVSPPDYLFYDDIIRNTKTIFHKVFKYDILDNKRFVLYAIKTPNKGATGFDGIDIISKLTKKPRNSKTIKMVIPNSTFNKIVEI